MSSENGHGPAAELEARIAELEAKNSELRADYDQLQIEANGYFLNWEDADLEASMARRHLRDALRERHSTDPDRYAGRRVDVAVLLANPPEPVHWRVGGLIADGTMTTISGIGGAGKSWLAQALCDGVSTGAVVAGFQCTRGVALYVDAEMGAQMFIDQRMRVAGFGAGSFHLRDAMGLDISRADDLKWLSHQIATVEANLVVIDSLRRLTPSKAENSSDDMAPVVSALAKLARDTGAAVLLIHHQGESEKLYRGSTAIRDQADALFGLLVENDPDDGLRRLTCRLPKGKPPRYAPEPAEVYLRVAPDEGGVVEADEPVVFGRVSDVELKRRLMLTVLPQSSVRAISDTTGIPKSTVGELLQAMAEDGRVRRSRDGWTAVRPDPDPRGSGRTDTPQNAILDYEEDR